MDRNTIFGILIIIGIFLVFFFVNKPSKEELEKQKKMQDSIEKVELKKMAEAAKKQKETANAVPVISADSLTTDSVVNDSAHDVRAKGVYGKFSSCAEGRQQFFTLENEKMVLVISAKGGRPYNVRLKEYKTWDQKPLILFDGDSTVFGLSFFADNRSISTNELFFTLNGKDSSLKAISKSQSLILRLNISPGKYIEYNYSLKPGAYMVDFTIRTVGMNDLISANTKEMTLNWDLWAPTQEKGRDFENNYAGVYYKFYEDEVSYLTETSDNEEALRTRVKWIAFKDQFFSSVIIAKSFFSGANVKHTKSIADSAYLKHFVADMTIPYEAKPVEDFQMKMYFGPNKFTTLKNQGEPDLDQLVPLGWGIFGWINRFAVIPIFNFLENNMGIASYGLIIFLLTVIIKIVLFPLTYKSYISQAKMRVLKPQIDEIQAKIPKDKAMERQQATMALYKKVGVSPLGGCLPMLLQFPILFALFRFFPTSIELRQKSFLWAEDLSSYDSVLDLPFNIPFYGAHVSLFCLLMTASTIVYTYIQNKSNPTSMSAPGMKIMMYMMPVMFLFFFNSYASGLSYYYFLANMLSFAQMAIIKRFVDDEEILSKLNENKKKVVKKSKFAQRLEDMAKKRGFRK